MALLCLESVNQKSHEAKVAKVIPKLLIRSYCKKKKKKSDTVGKETMIWFILKVALCRLFSFRCWPDPSERVSFSSCNFEDKLTRLDPRTDALKCMLQPNTFGCVVHPLCRRALLTVCKTEIRSCHGHLASATSNPIK